MATKKTVKVEACTFCGVSAGEFENKWGFRFEAIDVDGDLKLIAELDEEDATSFIKAGRCVKA